MKLPAAVGERHTFNVKDDTKNMIFQENTKVTVNEFLETMMSDPGPQCVSWLLVLHRSVGAYCNNGRIVYCMGNYAVILSLYHLLD